jgi:hypothetical protein
MKLHLNLPQIKDQYVRDAITSLYEELLNQSILRGEWTHYEFTFTSAVTNFRFRHHLGFLPKDVIVTSTTGVGAATFNYSLFTDTYLDITTTGACVVRAFIGSYKES